MYYKIFMIRIVASKSFIIETYNNVRQTEGKITFRVCPKKNLVYINAIILLIILQPREQLHQSRPGYGYTN